MKTLPALIVALLGLAPLAVTQDGYTIRSIADGNWSDSKVWDPQRTPSAADRVLITSKTAIVYDVSSDDVIHSIRVAGTLSFSKDRDTVLNVGDIRVQPGMAKDAGSGVDDVEKNGESHGRGKHAKPMPGMKAALELGTSAEPVPESHTAKIRLHFIEGNDETESPAIVCRPGGRFDVHGAPMDRTWVKLGASLKAGDETVTLSAEVSGWRIGDSVIVTAGPRDEEDLRTEEREIKAIEGKTITLNSPLKAAHQGEGEFRGEIANLSRNVVIESADPGGVRGHTMYHWESAGSISYARFAHLGKKGSLGRYPIHFHLVEDSMRGSSVVGAAIVDSHNRWVTIHGTQYMVVRDCVGYQSLGHGFFLEDGTEIYNVLDRNLAVQAMRGPRMKGMALPFDPNDGAGFWWANGKNTFSRNVATDNEEYGYRYDMQMSSQFDCNMPIRQPDGSLEKIDVRTIPIWRFEDNEAHTEGFYGMVVAANGDRQPDNAIRDEKMLERIRQVDWTGPDRSHPHTIKNLSIWDAHYAFRPHSPNMIMENVRLHGAIYGIYRPAFDGHVYTNLHISKVSAEPFNRGMDDASAQAGVISVDGLTFDHERGNQRTPLVQISDVNLSGHAATHFRNVVVNRSDQFKDGWPLINRGVGPRVPPITDGVPIFIHDYFGPDRDVKVVSTAAKDLMKDGKEYLEVASLTGNESLAAEVADVEWPEHLLTPVDDEPPATIITSVRIEGGAAEVRGVSHDNDKIVEISVNGEPATIVSSAAGVVNWSARVKLGADGLKALAVDDAGNRESTAHMVEFRK